MDLCNQSCSSSHLADGLAVFLNKKLNAGHHVQSVQPNLFIPAMLIGLFDFYHFITFSVILALAGGHKVSARQNLLDSFPCTFFN